MIDDRRVRYVVLELTIDLCKKKLEVISLSNEILLQSAKLFILILLESQDF